MVKKIRIKSILVSALCLAASGLMLSACDHEHEFGAWENTTPATCEEGGVRTRICKICSTPQNEEIPATGHDWEVVEVTKAATCELAGSADYICTVCETPETRNLDPLGHLYSDEYTTDVEPTTESEGSESRHCTREGCNSKTGIRTIAKLVVGETRYHVTLKGRGGRSYLQTGVLEVFAEDGTFFQEVQIKRAGDVSFKLPEGKYTVKVKDLLEGYSPMREEYELTPELVIELKAELLPEDGKAHNYVPSSVMHDATIEYYSGETTTISKLLKEYKAVHFVYYFTTCGSCNGEWGDLNEYYAEYGDEIAIIALNLNDEAKTLVAAHAAEYGINLPIAKGAALARKDQFNLTAAPVQIIIDREGVIVFLSGTTVHNIDITEYYDEQIRFAEILEAESAQPSKISYDLDLPVSTKTLLTAENEEQGARKN